MLMEELERMGLNNSEKKADEISDLDIKEIFNLVDVDHSGLVSRRVRGPAAGRASIMLFHEDAFLCSQTKKLIHSVLTG